MSVKILENTIRDILKDALDPVVALDFYEWGSLKPNFYKHPNFVMEFIYRARSNSNTKFEPEDNSVRFWKQLIRKTRVLFQEDVALDLLKATRRLKLPKYPDGIAYYIHPDVSFSHYDVETAQGLVQVITEERYTKLKNLRRQKRLEMLYDEALKEKNKRRGVFSRLSTPIERLRQAHSNLHRR